MKRSELVQCSLLIIKACWRTATWMRYVAVVSFIEYGIRLGTTNCVGQRVVRNCIANTLDSEL